MADKAKVAIIILNWNGWQDTVECLESLFKIDYSNFHLVVVDNGSNDASVQRLNAWSEGKANLEIIPLEQNLGFARGNNAGIKRALEANPDYILILNNDTVVEPDFLSLLVNCLEDVPGRALAAPQVLDYYRKDFWQKPIPKRLNLLTYLLYATQLYRLTTKNLKFDLNNPSKIYVAPGCCLLMKRDIFEQIGFFDEHTFLGWEEFIIAEKLFQRNLQSYFVPQSKIYHKVGKDTDRIQSIKKIKIFLSSEAYYQKNILKLGLIERVVIRIIRLIIYGAVLFHDVYEKRVKK